jgi:hypothetical protein
MSDGDLFLWRGMEFYEREVVERALRRTRQSWLPWLEERLAKIDNDDLYHKAMLIAEIGRLRRLLGIMPSVDASRAATRERVRQHRKRKPQGVVPRPHSEPAPPITAASVVEDARRQAEGVGSRGLRVKRKAEAGRAMADLTTA